MIIGCLHVSLATAQRMYQWEIYPSYHNSLKNVAGNEKIYSLCNNNLLSYQPDNQELYLYDKTNLLNESNIAFIQYNNSVQKLLIIYSDGNIDLLRKNETVINIPQYKNTNISNKDIHGVNISGKYALLSTAFGLVVLDMDKEVIVNTYTLERETYAAVIYENKLYAATTNGVYTGDMALNLLDKKNWNYFSPLVFTEMTVFDNCVFGNNHDEFLYKLSKASLSISRPFNSKANSS